MTLPFPDGLGGELGPCLARPSDLSRPQPYRLDAHKACSTVQAFWPSWLLSTWKLCFRCRRLPTYRSASRVLRTLGHQLLFRTTVSASCLGHCFTCGHTEPQPTDFKCSPNSTATSPLTSSARGVLAAPHARRHFVPSDFSACSVCVQNTISLWFSSAFLSPLPRLSFFVCVFGCIHILFWNFLHMPTALFLPGLFFLFIYSSLHPPLLVEETKNILSKFCL